MKHAQFVALAALAPAVYAQDTLHLPAKTGTANGKRIVLVAGDEEYRSEETCPMLAKIISQRHGFDCTVLFSQDPQTGFIDPNNQRYIPGTATLDNADLLIIGTRFRQLSPEQLAPFARYLQAGKPVIGFRTATHGFTGDAKSGDFAWNEFGLRILGEKWVNHHGEHKKEGTRSVIQAANAAHEVLRGVGEIFGTSDVYGIANLDQNAATILLRGAVTQSLERTSPALDGPKNAPMMPIAWLRDYASPNGNTTGRAFCTTMGASTDFTDENLRRLLINAALHLTGLPVPPRADVSLIDPFAPTPFGFLPNEHYQKLQLRPADFALGKSPSIGGAR